MKQSSKAALLSAFICPGAGHVYLKKYIPGAVIIGVAAYALYILLSIAVSSALEISDKLVSGQITPDIMVIRELVSQQQTEAEQQQASIATTALLIVWIIGILDSYRLGRARDQIQAKKDRKVRIE